MEFIKAGILSLSLIASIPSTVVYQAEPIEEITTLNMSAHELVDFYADKYGVNKELAHYIAKNESSYNKDAIGDLFPCKNKKSPYYQQDVYARGIYQITRCYHYNVTDEQAFDPEFNVEYGMKLIAQGEDVCKQQFTTCRDYYNDYSL